MDALSLIERSQSGDEGAMNALISLIQKDHMSASVRRYRDRNVLVEEEEIESVFLEACFKAAREAKLDVGNPLLFILWKGEMAVLHLFRKNVRNGVVATCSACGKTRTLSHRQKMSRCSSCDSPNVTTAMTTLNESQLLSENSDGNSSPWDMVATTDPHRSAEAAFNTATYDITVQEIRARLRGRVLELFDMLVIRGINRETSENYLAEIAREWGVTTPCVSIYLRKLRAAVTKYMAEQ